MFFAGIFILVSGGVVIWVSTIKIPDFKAFQDRKVESSTRIYDRTGKTVLYDVNSNTKRTIIAFADMGPYIKNATVAIEDSTFYQNQGIRPTAIIRALLVNITHGSFVQGGSTITQQIVKNSLLSSQKTITRKMEEWILALKMDREMSKEDILAIYLNEAPYGGNIYGVEEASKTYFGKEPANLTLAEASYLASIPKAPTFYSPYGTNRKNLDDRQKTVLARMKELNFITDTEYQNALKEKIDFKPQDPTGILAPHFVFFIKDYLIQKYGEDAVNTGGLQVTTTLDWDMQQKAEEVVKKYALSNEKTYNASNAGLVAIDPTTGQILSMVGSRDYFDKKIDGNYNIATAMRQPGSSFKPFVYATAFEKGYTPDTVLFDVPTEFSMSCNPSGAPLPGHNKSECYMPKNFNGLNSGPLSLRSALAQSVNVIGVKLLYLAGIQDSINTARMMGITSLVDAARYGLSLVLGGGEVKLIDMASAYGVFATGGVRHPETGILKVTDNAGNILESYSDEESQAIPKQIALQVTDILSDNNARAPDFGLNSAMYFLGRDVAAKTGTTNDSHDAWLVGYTPNISVGVWVGNNDNSAMAQQVSVVLSGPLWHEFMNYALSKVPDVKFEKPDPIDYTAIKPVLAGKWQGNESFLIDKISGGLATEYTPKDATEEKVLTNRHSILYWINKDDPNGDYQINSSGDPQYYHWEIPVQNWLANFGYKYATTTVNDKPNFDDNVHVPGKFPNVQITNPVENIPQNSNSKITITLSSTGFYPLSKVDFFINNNYIGSSTSAPFSFSFIPSQISDIGSINTLKIVAEDTVYNTVEVNKNFSISN